MRDDDLRSASFLDSTGFPSIAFASTEVTGDDTAITLVGVFTAANSTRAVISGRRTYELADRWQGDHHDGVPVFVLTHDVPDDPPPGSVRYVTDVRECASQARAVAGDGDVMVHGAGAAQALLQAGQLDELELHVVPVLLGQGRRLFDNLPAEHVELSLVRQLATPEDVAPAQQVMHLRYRVRRPSPPA